MILYQFSSAEEREAGFREFEHNTAAADLVAHKVFAEGPLLLFYTPADASAVKKETHNSIQAALAVLHTLAENGNGS